MTNSAHSFPFRWWRSSTLFFWVWGSLSTTAWFWDRWQGAHWVHVFMRTEGPCLVIQVPLSLGTQSMRLNNCWQLINIQSPWFFQKISTSADSLRSLTNTHPGEDVIRKWCNFLIPTIFFIRRAKKSVQSKVGTMVLPSSRDTSWTKLQFTEVLTTSAIDCKLPNFVLR